jgi:hypothetical protein
MRWLTTENSLAESPVEEDVLHVKLLNRPFAEDSNGEYRADGGQLHNWAASLINPRALRETPQDPTSLVLIECSIGELLMCEDPLVGDDVGATGPGKEFSCLIAHQGPILLHSCMLVRIGKGGADRGQNGGRRSRGSRGDESQLVTR